MSTEAADDTVLRPAPPCPATRCADRIWLTPWVHNRRALHFYAREGDADLDPTWFEFEGERHENRLLARPLPRPAQT